MVQRTEKEQESHLKRFRYAAKNSLAMREQTAALAEMDYRGHPERFSYLLLHHLTLPPGYFMDIFVRNAITGRITAMGIEPEFDFAFVDLSERPRLCCSPEDMEADGYVWKVEVMAERSWIYQRLVQQLEIARDGNSGFTHLTFRNEEAVHTTSRKDCIQLALEQACADGKRYDSSFGVLAIATFIASFSVDFFIMGYTLMLVLLSLWTCQLLNEPILFRLSRFFDLLPRFGYLIIIASNMMNLTGMIADKAWGQMGSQIILFALLLYDAFAGDIAFFIRYGEEKKFEVLKQLPLASGEENRDTATVFVCERKKARESSEMVDQKYIIKRGKKPAIPEWFTGELPETVDVQEVAIVMETHGVLLKLTPTKLKDILDIEKVLRLRDGRLLREQEVIIYKREAEKRAAKEAASKRAASRWQKVERVIAAQNAIVKAFGENMMEAKKKKAEQDAIDEFGVPEANKVKPEKDSDEEEEEEDPNKKRNSVFHRLMTGMGIAEKDKGKRKRVSSDNFTPVTINTIHVPLFSKALPSTMFRERGFMQKKKVEKRLKEVDEMENEKKSKVGKWFSGVSEKVSKFANQTFDER